MIKNGKIWPIGIGIATFFVVLLGAWTIRETTLANITQSNSYMSNYHKVDDNMNDIIIAKINFDKKYNLKLSQNGIGKKVPFMEYKITDKQNNPVKKVQMELLLSRPSDDVKDIIIKKVMSSNDGVYRFEDLNITKPGRWDVILKVSIGKDYRYLNLKTDTRVNKVVEF
jgi:nitrogen fixation protein FixH